MPRFFYTQSAAIRSVKPADTLQLKNAIVFVYNTTTSDQNIPISDQQAFQYRTYTEIDEETGVTKVVPIVALNYTPFLHTTRHLPIHSSQTRPILVQNAMQYHNTDTFMNLTNQNVEYYKGERLLVGNNDDFSHSMKYNSSNPTETSNNLFNHSHNDDIPSSFGFNHEVEGLVDPFGSSREKNVRFFGIFENTQNGNQNSSLLFNQDLMPQYQFQNLPLPDRLPHDQRLITQNRQHTQSAHHDQSRSALDDEIQRFKSSREIKSSDFFAREMIAEKNQENDQNSDSKMDDNDNFSEDEIIHHPFNSSQDLQFQNESSHDGSYSCNNSGNYFDENYNLNFYNNLGQNNNFYSSGPNDPNDLNGSNGLNGLNGLNDPNDPNNFFNNNDNDFFNYNSSSSHLYSNYRPTIDLSAQALDSLNRSNNEGQLANLGFSSLEDIYAEREYIKQQKRLELQKLLRNDENALKNNPNWGGMTKRTAVQNATAETIVIKKSKNWGETLLKQLNLDKGVIDIKSGKRDKNDKSEKKVGEKKSPRQLKISRSSSLSTSNINSITRKGNLVVIDARNDLNLRELTRVSNSSNSIVFVKRDHNASLRALKDKDLSSENRSNDRSKKDKKENDTKRSKKNQENGCKNTPIQENTLTSTSPRVLYTSQASKRSLSLFETSQHPNPFESIDNSLKKDKNNNNTFSSHQCPSQNADSADSADSADFANSANSRPSTHSSTLISKNNQQYSQSRLAKPRTYQVIKDKYNSQNELDLEGDQFVLSQMNSQLSKENRTQNQNGGQIINFSQSNDHNSNKKGLLSSSMFKKHLIRAEAEYIHNRDDLQTDQEGENLEKVEEKHTLVESNTNSTNNLSTPITRPKTPAFPLSGKDFDGFGSSKLTSPTKKPRQTMQTIFDKSYSPTLSLPKHSKLSTFDRTDFNSQKSISKHVFSQNASQSFSQNPFARASQAHAHGDIHLSPSKRLKSAKQLFDIDVVITQNSISQRTNIMPQNDHFQSINSQTEQKPPSLVQKNDLADLNPLQPLQPHKPDQIKQRLTSTLQSLQPTNLVPHNPSTAPQLSTTTHHISSNTQNSQISSQLQNSFQNRSLFTPQTTSQFKPTPKNSQTNTQYRIQSQTPPATQFPLSSTHAPTNDDFDFSDSPQRSPTIKPAFCLPPPSSPTPFAHKSLPSQVLQPTSSPNTTRRGATTATILSSSRKRLTPPITIGTLPTAAQSPIISPQKPTTNSNRTAPSFVPHQTNEKGMVGSQIDILGDDDHKQRRFNGLNEDTRQDRSQNDNWDDINTDFYNIGDSKANNHITQALDDSFSLDDMSNKKKTNLEFDNQTHILSKKLQRTAQTKNHRLTPQIGEKMDLYNLYDHKRLPIDSGRDLGDIVDKLDRDLSQHFPTPNKKYGQTNSQLARSLQKEKESPHQQYDSFSQTKFELNSQLSQSGDYSHASQKNSLSMLMDDGMGMIYVDEHGKTGGPQQDDVDIFSVLAQFNQSVYGDKTANMINRSSDQINLNRVDQPPPHKFGKEKTSLSSLTGAELGAQHPKKDQSLSISFDLDPNSDNLFDKAKTDSSNKKVDQLFVEPKSVFDNSSLTRHMSLKERHLLKKTVSMDDDNNNNVADVDDDVDDDDDPFANSSNPIPAKKKLKSLHKPTDKQRVEQIGRIDALGQFEFGGNDNDNDNADGCSFNDESNQTEIISGERCDKNGKLFSEMTKEEQRAVLRRERYLLRKKELKEIQKLEKTQSKKDLQNIQKVLDDFSTNKGINSFQNALNNTHSAQQGFKNPGKTGIEYNSHALNPLTDLIDVRQQQHAKVLDAMIKQEDIKKDCGSNHQIRNFQGNFGQKAPTNKISRKYSTAYTSERPLKQTYSTRQQYISGPQFNQIGADQSSINNQPLQLTYIGDSIMSDHSTNCFSTLAPTLTRFDKLLQQHHNSQYSQNSADDRHQTTSSSKNYPLNSFEVARITPQVSTFQKESISLRRPVTLSKANVQHIVPNFNPLIPAQRQVTDHLLQQRIKEHERLKEGKRSDDYTRPSSQRINEISEPVGTLDDLFNNNQNTSVTAQNAFRVDDFFHEGHEKATKGRHSRRGELQPPQDTTQHGLPLPPPITNHPPRVDHHSDFSSKTKETLDRIYKEQKERQREERRAKKQIELEKKYQQFSQQSQIVQNNQDFYSTSRDSLKNGELNPTSDGIKQQRQSIVRESHRKNIGMSQIGMSSQNMANFGSKVLTDRNVFSPTITGAPSMNQINKKSSSTSNQPVSNPVKRSFTLGASGTVTILAVGTPQTLNKANEAGLNRDKKDEKRDKKDSKSDKKDNKEKKDKKDKKNDQAMYAPNNEDNPFQSPEKLKKANPSVNSTKIHNNNDHNDNEDDPFSRYKTTPSTKRRPAAMGTPKSAYTPVTSLHNNNIDRKGQNENNTSKNNIDKLNFGDLDDNDNYLRDDRTKGRSVVDFDNEFDALGHKFDNKLKQKHHKERSNDGSNMVTLEPNKKDKFIDIDNIESLFNHLENEPSYEPGTNQNINDVFGYSDEFNTGGGGGGGGRDDDEANILVALSNFNNSNFFKPEQNSQKEAALPKNQLPAAQKQIPQMKALHFQQGSIHPCSRPALPTIRSRDDSIRYSDDVKPSDAKKRR